MNFFDLHCDTISKCFFRRKKSILKNNFHLDVERGKSIFERWVQTFAFWPVHTANLNAIKALGRSDLFLKLEIVKKIVGLLALFATMYISVEAMAISLIITSVLGQIINSWPNQKLLDYSYLDQVKDMLPQIGMCCLMGVVLFCVQLLNLDDVFTLLIQITLGMLSYLLVSRLLHIESFEYLTASAKGYLKNK